MCSSSPKSTHKTVTLRSSNFVSKGFFVEQGKSAVNPFGLTSILTKQQREILASKSNSGLNALALTNVLRLCKLNNSFIIFKSTQLAVFKLYVLEISFTASAGASDALYEKFCLEHKNIKFEFQENINKEKTAASKMLTAVHLLLELF